MTGRQPPFVRPVTRPTGAEAGNDSTRRRVDILDPSLVTEDDVVTDPGRNDVITEATEQNKRTCRGPGFYTVITLPRIGDEKAVTTGPQGDVEAIVTGARVQRRHRPHGRPLLAPAHRDDIVALPGPDRHATREITAGRTVIADRSGREAGDRGRRHDDPRIPAQTGLVTDEQAVMALAGLDRQIAPKGREVAGQEFGVIAEPDGRLRGDEDTLVTGAEDEPGRGARPPDIDRVRTTAEADLERFEAAVIDAVEHVETADRRARQGQSVGRGIGRVVEQEMVRPALSIDTDRGIDGIDPAIDVAQDDRVVAERGIDEPVRDEQIPDLRTEVVEAQVRRLTDRVDGYPETEFVVDQGGQGTHIGDGIGPELVSEVEQATEPVEMIEPGLAVLDRVVGALEELPGLFAMVAERGIEGLGARVLRYRHRVELRAEPARQRALILEMAGAVVVPDAEQRTEPLRLVEVAAGVGQPVRATDLVDLPAPAHTLAQHLHDEPRVAPDIEIDLSGDPADVDPSALTVIEARRERPDVADGFGIEVTAKTEEPADRREVFPVVLAVVRRGVAVDLERAAGVMDVQAVVATAGIDARDGPGPRIVDRQDIVPVAEQDVHEREVVVVDPEAHAEPLDGVEAPRVLDILARREASRDVEIDVDGRIDPDLARIRVHDDAAATGRKGLEPRNEGIPFRRYRDIVPYPLGEAALPAAGDIGQVLVGIDLADDGAAIEDVDEAACRQAQGMGLVALQSQERIDETGLADLVPILDQALDRRDRDIGVHP